MNNPGHPTTAPLQEGSAQPLDPSLFPQERLLVTGGSGFIGSNVIERCLQLGWEVCNLSDAAPFNPALNEYWTKVDLLDKLELIAAFEKFQPTLVFHLGSRTDMHGTSLPDYAANIEGVENVIDAVEKVKPRRVIYASSRLVFRIDAKPAHDYDYSATTWYGKSKIETEKIIKRRDGGGVPWVMVRPTSIWGPWFKIPYRTFFNAVQSGRYLHPKGQHVVKSFGYVGNIVHELLCLSQVETDKVNRRVFFLADYESLDVLGWARLISQGLNAPPVREVPYGVLKTIALAGDLSGKLGMKNVPLNSFRLNNLTCNMTYDMEPLRQVVGPVPFSLEEGVKATCEWMKQH